MRKRLLAILSGVIFIMLMLTACKKNCAHTYQITYQNTSSCTQADKEIHTCKHCKDSFTKDIPAKEHVLSKGTERKPATCSKPGLMDYFCTVCDEVITKETPLLEHVFGEGVVEKEATDTEPGILAYECNYCDAIKQEEIPVASPTP